MNADHIREEIKNTIEKQVKQVSVKTMEPKFKKDQQVKVLPHTRYQTLQGGATVAPIKHELKGGQIAVIYSVLDENGLVYETDYGMFEEHELDELDS